MLTRVTITGADDDVAPGALADLSEEFPFVEWAILFSTKRAGTSRYPSQAWIQRLQAIALVRPMRLAAHLCGSAARDALAGDELTVRIAWFQRVQINGYPAEGASRDFLEMATGLPAWELILQARDEASLARVAEDARQLGDARASILFDPSGGRGLEAQAWPAPPPGVRMGYAGGIKPSTVLDVMAAIGPVSQPFWIDMESGVRAEGDHFDLGLCQQVLQKVAPFVTQAAR